MSRRPIETPFNQQKLTTIQFRLHINWLIGVLFIFGAIFTPIGVMLLEESNRVMESNSVYDASSGMDVDCSISYSNEGGNCSITFDFDKDVTGPFYLYYKITGFYQNHRRYIQSVSSNQLLGQNLNYDEVESDCYPLTANGSTVLNPCGLIANSFFNDIITLDTSTVDVELDEDGISWPIDVADKYSNVDGFVYAQVTDTSLSCADVLGSTDYDDCQTYSSTALNETYYYWYPDDDTVQYLHESYPGIVSPIDGVTNEHFINWMRTAGLPHFRKLYGKLDTDFNSGDSITFNIETNFQVTNFGGTKALVLTNLASFGGRNTAIGYSYLALGVYSLFVGLFFTVKRLAAPRPLGDIRHLRWETS